MAGIHAKILAPLYINQYVRRCPPNLVCGQYMPCIPHISKPRKLFNIIVSRIALRKIVPDIVHETYFCSQRLASAKSRIVLTVYDMIHEKFNPLFRNPEKTIAAKAQAIKRADHIICISDNTKQDLFAYYQIPIEKVSVIHLASSFAFHSDTPFRKVMSTEPFMLYVGARYAYKNFQQLLSAYAKSKKLRTDFSLVCFGGKPFSREENSFMQSLGISSEKIKHVSGDDTVLADYYKTAAAFVCPSLYEGFCIPLLEAMSCHCPVICSNTSSLPEVAQNAAEYFDPFDEENMIHALESVLYSHHRRQELIRQGHERVRCFSWDRTAEQTAHIYSSLC